MKFNLPMASSTTLLTLGLLYYADAYSDAGEMDNMYDSIKWPLDYFLKCWREDKTNFANSKYYATVLFYVPLILTYVAMKEYLSII